MNPFKDKKQPKQKPQWAYKCAFGIVLLMLGIWLVSILKPDKPISQEQKDNRFEALVDSAVVVSLGEDGKIFFRAEPAKITYAEVPDKTHSRYTDLLQQKEYFEGLNVITEETKKIIDNIDSEIEKCTKNLGIQHSPDEIHFIVQKIKVNIGDSLTVHAFAKVKPDYSSCDLEVTRIVRNEQETTSSDAIKALIDNTEN